MTGRFSTLIGADAIPRCGWVGNDPEYERYHDAEWGRPLHGDRPLFEKIALEGFQAGLSWITILRRRDAFREAFHGFAIERVAAMEPADIDSLLLDDRIIRNRAKIEATIANARITLKLAEGELDSVVWSCAPAPGRPRPRSVAEVPAVTAESTALSAALRSRGYRFVGPTTMYALMQSAGLVDDHVVGCHRSS
ncbi:MAG: DNA-3-methyladenine glycosylase I [Rhodoglobus sp.]